MRIFCSAFGRISQHSLLKKGFGYVASRGADRRGGGLTYFSPLVRFGTCGGKPANRTLHPWAEVRALRVPSQPTAEARGFEPPPGSKFHRGEVGPTRGLRAPPTPAWGRSRGERQPSPSGRGPFKEPLCGNPSPQSGRARRRRRRRRREPRRQLLQAFPGFPRASRAWLRPAQPSGRAGGPGACESRCALPAQRSRRPRESSRDPAQVTPFGLDPGGGRPRPAQPRARRRVAPA